MKKPIYIPGQSVEVEFHNAMHYENPDVPKTSWLKGKVLAVVPATDIDWRVEVECKDEEQTITLKGHIAAHPDCVRPLLNNLCS